MVKLPEYHVLHYFYDNDNGCSLTAQIRGTRYHIVAEASRLQDRSRKGKRIWRAYSQLLAQVKAAEQGEDWENTAPLFVQEDEDEDEDGSERTTDSGIDVSSPDEEKEEEHDCGPTKALERWMLKPLIDSFPEKESKEPSVEEWYHCPTHYGYLTVKEGKVHWEEDNSPSSALTKRVDALIPSLMLPKYIMELDIPLINAQELHVKRTSEEPGPLHPSVVSLDGKELFLKTVGFGPYQPMVKRELQVMKQIEAKDLRKEIRVPLLRGLVHFASATSKDGKQEAMGFLMDAISNPTPLTHMLDSEIPEEKRLRWAEESARMVDVLHQNGIVWGDAKGDNFMVDSNDDLWIIDFGGSYTEGWVDEAIKESEAGDEQGTQKVVNGLKDPDNNCIDPEEEEEEEGLQDKSARKSGNKRKLRSDDEEEAADGKHSPKQARREESENNDEKPTKTSEGSSDNRPNAKLDERSEESEGPIQADQGEEERWCYCNGSEKGEMLACDGEDCKRQWFHFPCVGIKEAPNAKKWYCKDCCQDN